MNNRLLDARTFILGGVMAMVCLVAGGCTLTVDKRVGVWFEEGAQPQFPTLPGGIANGETAVASAENGAAADATNNQPGGSVRANWQFGLFTFNTVHSSETESDLAQALRAGLTANVPMQGSTVESSSEDTGEVAADTEGGG